MSSATVSRLFVGAISGLACLCAAAALAGNHTPPDPKAASPDTEFLEFLGSGDDVDPDLQQYLASPKAATNDDDTPAPSRGSGRT